MTTTIAWRYFKSKKSTNAINIIAWISMTAIAIVTAALVIVLSVFNGFEDMVKTMYDDFYADIKIEPAKGKTINNTITLSNQLKQIKAIVNSESIVEERAIIIDEEDKSIISLKGVDPTYEHSSKINQYIYKGSFNVGTLNTPNIILGGGIEHSLQINVGQAITPIAIYLPNRFSKNPNNPMDAMISSNAFPIGSFSIQQEFDNKYAFTNKDFLSHLLSYDSNQCSYIEVFAAKNTNLNTLKKEISSKIGQDFNVLTRYEQNQNLFSAMQTEKLIIFAVAGLILIIAAFNIISSLTMTVLEKQQDIAVMQSLGFTNSAITTIFLKLGVILAGLGGLIGFVLGSVVCIIQQKFHLIKLGGNSFLIDYFPVSMRISDIIIVLVIIITVAFISGWLPSRRAAKSFYSLKS